MNDLSVAEVLERAADLIEPEGKWTQFADARDKNGRSLAGPNGSKAVCFCAEGAIQKAAAAGRSSMLVQRAFFQVENRTHDNLAAWNDEEGRSQSEVVSSLREAAKLAREQ